MDYALNTKRRMSGMLWARLYESSLINASRDFLLTVQTISLCIGKEQSGEGNDEGNVSKIPRTITISKDDETPRAKTLDIPYPCLSEAETVVYTLKYEPRYPDDDNSLYQVHYYTDVCELRKLAREWRCYLEMLENME